MAEIITSTSNPRIKNIIRLQEKSSERREQGFIVIEGRREISLAIGSGIHVLQLFVCKELAPKNISVEELGCVSAEVFEIAPHVFEKLAYRDASDGIIALAKPRELSLASLHVSNAPLILILESVEKPGNLGAVLRTADAANVDAVLVSDPLTDIYNPNVIRASIGCVFTVPVIPCKPEEALSWLKEKNVRILAAALQDASDFYIQDLTMATAIVLGTEAHGLGPFWREHADAIVKIPMLGKIDSLNVSASMAIMTFEAKRQRGFK
jgi:TrmH family RNA methyltransferase